MAGIPGFPKNIRYSKQTLRALQNADPSPRLYGTTRRNAAADLLIRQDTYEYEAEHIYDLDPWHPLIRLALAGFEEDPIRTDFLRRYFLDRLSDDPKLRRRAAEFLRNQGKEVLARKMEVRGNKLTK